MTLRVENRMIAGLFLLQSQPDRQWNSQDHKNRLFWSLGDESNFKQCTVHTT